MRSVAKRIERRFDSRARERGLQSVGIDCVFVTRMQIFTCIVRGGTDVPLTDLPVRAEHRTARASVDVREKQAEIRRQVVLEVRGRQEIVVCVIYADADERASYRILLRAVEEPIRVLASNAGYDPSEVMAKIQHAGDGWGFDLETGQVRPMAESGIYDIATVQKEAVHSAIASAALALTVDVVIHRRKQVESIEP